MLNVRVICLGKLQEPFWQAAVGEYQKRLGGLCRLEILQLPEEKLPQNPSEAQIQGALDREARLILPKLKGAVYPLCIEGGELCGWQLPRPGGAGQGGGPGHLHVQDDFSPPAGPGDALRANLPGLSDSAGQPLS